MLISRRVTHSLAVLAGLWLSPGLVLVCLGCPGAIALHFGVGEALFSLQSNEVSLYDCGAHHNQSYTGGVNRTETNAAVTLHSTLPV